MNLEFSGRDDIDSTSDFSSVAIKEHSCFVFLMVKSWKKLMFGCVPLGMDQPVAPECLLKMVYCVAVKQDVAETAAARNYDCIVHKFVAILWAKHVQIFKWLILNLMLKIFCIANGNELTDSTVFIFRYLNLFIFTTMYVVYVMKSCFIFLICSHQ